jgi:hypothetical protein
MVRARIFHVIGTSETILMACLSVIACGTHVPILHVKSTQETHILICKQLDNVGEVGCRLLSRWLYISRDVWDDARAANTQDLGGHRGAVVSYPMFTKGMSVVDVAECN